MYTLNTGTCFQEQWVKLYIICFITGPCNPDPCLNGASCVDLGDDFFCECPVCDCTADLVNKTCGIKAGMSQTMQTNTTPILLQLVIYIHNFIRTMIRTITYMFMVCYNTYQQFKIGLQFTEYMHKVLVLIERSILIYCINGIFYVYFPYNIGNLLYTCVGVIDMVN